MAACLLVETDISVLHSSVSIHKWFLTLMYRAFSFFVCNLYNAQIITTYLISVNELNKLNHEVTLL